MRHQEGEAHIKSLQKKFLLWVEEHQVLGQLDHGRFNNIRRQAFSSTFEAFRLGRIGLKQDLDPITLWKKFFGWASVVGLPNEVELELQAKCFSTSLEAFRVGAMVTGRDNDGLHDR